MSVNFNLLERAWNINIPGFSSSDTPKQQKRALPTEAHKQVSKAVTVISRQYSSLSLLHVCVLYAVSVHLVLI